MLKPALFDCSFGPWGFFRQYLPNTCQTLIAGEGVTYINHAKRGRKRRLSDRKTSEVAWRMLQSVFFPVMVFG